MLEHEFTGQIARIKSCFPTLADEMIGELLRRWRMIDGTLFKQIVTWVIDHARFAPKPKDFLDGYEAVVGTWRQPETATTGQHTHGIGGEAIPMKLLLWPARNPDGSSTYERIVDPLNAIPCAGMCPVPDDARAVQAFRSLAEIMKPHVKRVTPLVPTAP